MHRITGAKEENELSRDAVNIGESKEMHFFACVTLLEKRKEQPNQAIRNGEKVLTLTRKDAKPQ
jgi:hypothetical protein